MAYVHKKEHFFTLENEKLIFNAIVKYTLAKEIVWIMRPAMFRGDILDKKILFYSSDIRVSISIQNKTDYVFFEITREQEELLKKVISGKTVMEIDNPENFSFNLWSGKAFFELSKALPSPAN